VMRQALRKISAGVGMVAVGVAISFAGLAMQLVSSPTASAYTCAGGPIFDSGRKVWCGYFTNKFDDGVSPPGEFVLSNGVPAGVNSVATLTAYILSLRNGANAQDKTGAEFIIETMLGISGPASNRALATTLFQPPGAGSCALAANAGYWTCRVAAEAAAGDINWNYAYPFPCGVENTYYQAGGNNDDAFFTDGDDGCGPGVTKTSIAFLNPNNRSQVIYAIKRQCGNPIGLVNGLPVPSTAFNVTLAASASGAPGPSPYQVIAGKTYASGVVFTLHNSGPNASIAGNLDIEYPGATITAPCGGACNPAGAVQVTGGHNPTRGYQSSPSVIPGVTTPYWYYGMTAFPNGFTGNGALTFTVSPTAAVGSIITFNLIYYPSNDANAKATATVKFIVVSERTPSVVGVNGDVHAGGGICGQAQTPTPSNVQGDASATSGTQYVVSATGTVNDFSSNNKTAANNLTLGGANGAYADVCREDLLAAAVAYESAGGGLIIGPTVNINTLSPLSNVFYSNSGTLTLTGPATVNRKITIVSLGNVVISGDISLGGGSNTGNAQPSLGIISAGSINIDSGVTRIDAYLFADGAIDTCAQFAQVPNPCTANLLVNGFLMGQSIAFHRIGPTNTNGAPIAEQIILNPQIYLNPPMFFDATVDNTTIENDGEQQPLF
jgi:hypothetical protein